MLNSGKDREFKRGRWVWITPFSIKRSRVNKLILFWKKNYDVNWNLCSEGVVILKNLHRISLLIFILVSIVRRRIKVRKTELDATFLIDIHLPSVFPFQAVDVIDVLFDWKPQLIYQYSSRGVNKAASDKSCLIIIIINLPIEKSRN